MNANTNNEDPYVISFLPVQQKTAFTPARAGAPVEMSSRSDAEKNLEIVTANIKEMAVKISTTLATLKEKIEENAPDTCTVKFAFGVTGEGNFIIGTAGASAGIEVSATWNK